MIIMIIIGCVCAFLRVKSWIYVRLLASRTLEIKDDEYLVDEETYIWICRTKLINYKCIRERAIKERQFTFKQYRISGEIVEEYIKLGFLKQQIKQINSKSN